MYRLRTMCRPQLTAGTAPSTTIVFRELTLLWINHACNKETDHMQNLAGLVPILDVKRLRIWCGVSCLPSHCFACFAWA